MDVGVVTYTDCEGEERRQVFNGNFAIGLAAGIAQQTQYFSFLGKHKYSVSQTIGMMTRKKVSLKSISIDGTALENCSVDSLMVSVGQYALGLRMAPFAQVDDGLLDVTLLQGSSYHMSKVISKLPSGGHVFKPQCKYYRAKEIEICLKPRDKVTFSVDGEVFRAKGNLRVSVVCDLVRVPFGHQY